MIRWSSPRLLLPLAVFALCALASHAAPPAVTSFAVGIADQLQAGRWAPVDVSLHADQGPFDGQVYFEATDGDGIPYRIPAAETPIVIQPGEKRRLLFHFKPAALDNELRLTFVEADGKTTSQMFSVDDERSSLAVPRALPASERLIVGVGPSLGLVEAFDDLGETGLRLAQAVELTSLESLPSEPLGYDAVDTLFIATSDAAINAAWLADTQRVQAVAAWTRRGGRLVVCIGREAATVLADGHPFAKLIPGRYESQVTLLSSQMDDWEAYADSRRPLPVDEEVGERLRVPLVLDFEGKVEAPTNFTAGQPPLVARAPYGLGEVVFIAADLDQPPFARWAGRANLLLRAARSRPPGETAPGAGASRAAPQHDLVEQLQRALDVFPGVRLATFLWVAILALGYIALIGPGDYGLLQRVLRRMELTWLTFPLLVALTTFGVYRVARALKGDELRVNQIDVIDVDAAGNVRGTTIANIFSPKMAAFDLALRPAIAVNAAPQNPRAFLSGFALQPSALVGESDRTAIAPLSADSYRYAAPLDRVGGLPIHIWSSKSIAAIWYAAAPAPIASDLRRGADGQLQGELRVTADLALQDCWLVDNNFVARLGDIAPGAAISIGPRAGTSWSTLNTQLSYQRRVKKSPGKEDVGIVGTQWDPESADVREIVRQILFYDAAGGANYTRAANGALRRLDLSPRRDLGEAIFVGYVKSSAEQDATEFQNGHEPLRGAGDQRWTVLRVLLPISK